jgi:hypothetical protein
MTDTQWADISQFQVTANDSYPYRALSFRSNDGTYRDPHFVANRAWCDSAIARGRLDFYIVYVVYEPDNEAWAQTAINMIGAPNSRMVVMIDLESWSGRISGDHSADINAGRALLAKWLGSLARVIGYGNANDLARIWPNRGNAHIVLANYSADPPFPGKIAHQYTSQATVAPFGHPVDMNSADGYDMPTLMGVLGLTATPTDVNVHPFTPTSNPEEDDIMRFLFCKDSGGNLWTLLNTSTGKTAQTRDQAVADGWASALGNARGTTAEALVSALAAVKSTLPVPPAGG